MIFVDVAQGTAEWAAARAGIPTASAFHRIMTPRTMKPSSSADKYLCELLAERLLGQPLQDFDSGFMLRGSELEKRAVTAYEFEQEADTTPVGFVLRDDRRVGCSPDRLVGTEGLLEIKCCSAAVHVGALLGMADDDHRSQCQGQMWLTERRWVDLLFYNPDLPPAQIRVGRDEAYIEALAGLVDAFCGRLDEAQQTLEKLTRPSRAA